MTADFERLLEEIRACRICAGKLAHEPRPVLRARATARLCIASQAPGTRVHASGMPFTDPSGDRLRDWLGLDKETFYDQARVAIVPMGFCFPGLDDDGGDLPPRKECAPHWRERVFAGLPELKLTLLVGSYAQAYYLGGRRAASMTENVRRFADYLPEFFVLPHPSWRTLGWARRNPWFARRVLPALRRRIRAVLAA